MKAGTATIQRILRVITRLPLWLRIASSIVTLVWHLTPAQSQTLYTRNTRLTIAPHTTVYVKGDVENEGTMQNNGHLSVSGSWVNSGTYQPGEGTVTFNSASATVPQIIHHNGQAFNTITLSGGTKKIIVSDVVVEAGIRFDHGIVEGAGNSRLVLNENAVISGASDSSHVFGLVFQRGSGHKLFPIGNGTVYLPVELPDVPDPLAMIGVQALEFGPALAKSPGLKSISEKRYWRIDVASGSLGNSRIVLPLRDESWTVDMDRVVVVQSSLPTEHFNSIGGVVQEGTLPYGRVTSESGVSMPFVALATEAERAEVVVHNAVSGNGDNLNDYARIVNIEEYPDNKFSVFNRWGDKVFEIENYNNTDRVFKGWSNLSGDARLPSATYFYVLEIPGVEPTRGFIVVKN